MNRQLDRRTGAVALAVIFAILFCGNVLYLTGFGINVPIMTAAFLAVVTLCRGGGMSARSLALAVLALLFASSFALFNNPHIQFLNGAALLSALSAQALLSAEPCAQGAWTPAFAKGVLYNIFVRPFHRFGAAWSELRGEKPRPESANRFMGYAGVAEATPPPATPKAPRPRHGRVFGIAIGLVIALPIAGVVLLLLSDADRVFADYARRLVSSEFIWNAAVMFVLAVGMTGIFGSGLLSLATVEKRFAEKQRTQTRASAVPVIVVAATLDLLLLAFCAIQFVYLTGATALPHGLSYSEYAREGFFQLCGVAVICVCVTLAGLRYSSGSRGGERTLARALLTALCLATLLLLVSAFARMTLYEQVYHFTRLRIYTQAFMIMLSIGLFALMARIWFPAFKLGRAAYFIGCVCLIALTFFNADAFIAARNAPHMDKRITAENVYADCPSDLDYLLTLSADAVPYYIDYVDAADLPVSHEDARLDPDYPESAAIDAKYAQRRWLLDCKRINADADDLRTWNLGRSAARAAIEASGLLGD